MGGVADQRVISPRVAPSARRLRCTSRSRRVCRATIRPVIVTVVRAATRAKACRVTTVGRMVSRTAASRSERSWEM